jgi:hypothetical protein
MVEHRPQGRLAGLKAGGRIGVAMCGVRSGSRAVQVFHEHVK